MFVLSKWMSELKQKKRLKDKLKAEKKKTEQLKRKAEVKQKQKEAIFEAEANKVENFVDEAFLEAIDTLNIYQKCLEDEQKKLDAGFPKEHFEEQVDPNAMTTREMLEKEDENKR